MIRSRRSIELRRLRFWLTLSAAIALIPWIGYLALTLPQNYVAQNWRATWVGFDILLLIFITATAVLGFLQHQLLTHFAFSTGVLLICDAWFDLMTARRGDIVTSVLTAVFGELPLAAVFIGATLRIVRLQLPPFSRGLFPLGLLRSRQPTAGRMKRASRPAIRRPHPPDEVRTDSADRYPGARPTQKSV